MLLIQFTTGNVTRAVGATEDGVTKIVNGVQSIYALAGEGGRTQPVAERCD
jgi:hypothetical protein